MNRIVLLAYIIFFSSFCFGQVNFEQNVILDGSQSILYAKTAIAIDMDSDGDLDVVSSCNYYKKIVWQENLDGQGNFSHIKNLSTEVDGIVSIFGIDIDGDGDNDIVAADVNTGELIWFENVDGIGESIQKHLIDINLNVLNDVGSADIDGDGDSDIVAILYDKVVWYENTDGFGSFGSQNFINDNISLGTALDIDDLDGDGYLDVISASSNDSKVTWYKNLDGLGSFGGQQLISQYGSNISDVSAADIDGDGDMDVVSCSRISDIIIWHENIDGLGNYGTNHIITFSADGPTSISCEDINGDGDIDIVSAEPDGLGKAVYYDNNGEGDFIEAYVMRDNITSPESVFVADLDNDGKNDVLTSSQYYGKLTWYSFNEMEDQFNYAKLPMIDTNVLNNLQSIDMDNDGDLDFATSSFFDGELSWFENLDGQGLFGNQIIITNKDRIINSSLYADIDNDGDMDVITISSNPNTIFLYENLDGQGNFGSEIEINQLLGANNVSAGDIDGDGDLDLVISSESYDTVHLIINSGDLLNFETPILITDQINSPYEVKFVDVDTDNDLDIMLVSATYGGLFWFENIDGLGQFTSLNTIIPYEGFYLYNKFLNADIDSDGDMDVIISYEDSGAVFWYENLDGNGNYSSGNFIVSSSSGGFKPISVADIDLDNDLDIVLRGYGKLSWIENTDGIGDFSIQHDIDLNLNFSGLVAISDVDNDGDGDIITGSQTISSIRLFKNLTTLSIDNLNTLTYVNIYPNPFFNKINIDLKNEILISQINIYDLTGKRIYFQNENLREINLDKLQSGIYLLELLSENKKATLKIVKQ